LPETYLESQELIAEIRNLRPQWLLPKPNLREIRRLRYDWLRQKGGFWSRAQTDQEIAHIKELEDAELEEARRESREIRRRIADSAPRAGEHTRLADVFTLPLDGTPGWKGEPVEYWRMPALINMFACLSKYANPVREWVDAEVDVPRMLSDHALFNSFWLYEARAEAVPRLWLRAAFEFMQSWRKVTDGTPTDSRFAAHLVDADIVMSADKNFVHFAERCHKEAPFATAATRQLSGGAVGVEELVGFLKNVP
jgi:hypothetical protein